MIRRSNHPVWLTFIALLTLCVLTSLTVSASASPGTGWELTSDTRPTNLEPGGKGLVEIEIFNIGAGIPNGKVTVTDILPPGLTAVNAGQVHFSTEEGTNAGVGYGIWRHSTGRQPWECTGAHVVTCTTEPGLSTFTVAGGGAGAAQPIQMAIAVNVASEPGVSGTFPNLVTVSG